MAAVERDAHGNFDVTQVRLGDVVTLVGTVIEITGNNGERLIKLAEGAQGTPGFDLGNTWISRAGATRLITDKA